MGPGDISTTNDLINLDSKGTESTQHKNRCASKAYSHCVVEQYTIFLEAVWKSCFARLGGLRAALRAASTTALRGSPRSTNRMANESTLHTLSGARGIQGLISKHRKNTSQKTKYTCSEVIQKVTKKVPKQVPKWSQNGAKKHLWTLFWHRWPRLAFQGRFLKPNGYPLGVMFGTIWATLGYLFLCYFRAPPKVIFWLQKGTEIDSFWESFSEHFPIRPNGNFWTPLYRKHSFFCSRGTLKRAKNRRKNKVPQQVP